MTVRGRRLGALLVSAGIAITVAGCSNHSGLRRLRPTDGASVASPVPAGPSGPGGPSGVAAPGSSAPRSSPATTSPTTSPAAPTSTTTSRGRSRHAPSGGSHSPTRPAAGPTTRPAPPAPPSAGASPSTGLAHGQHVEVTGAHFGGNVRVDVDECRSDLTNCTGYADVTVRTSARGSFAASYSVSSIVALNFCGAHGCVLRIRPAGGNPLAVPISFR